MTFFLSTTDVTVNNILAIVFAAAFTIIGLVLIWEGSRFHRKGIVVMGRVNGVQSEGEFYYPILQFTEQETGKVIEFVDMNAGSDSPDEFQPGQEFPVAYLPENPVQARIASPGGYYGMGIVLLVAAFFIFMFIIAVIFFGYKYTLFP